MNSLEIRASSAASSSPCRSPAIGLRVIRETDALNDERLAAFHDLCRVLSQWDCRSERGRAIRSNRRC